MNHMAHQRTFSPDMGQEIRELPANLEAEQAVLGAVLMNNRMMDRISFLAAEDFHEDIHRRIFSECLRLHGEGAPFSAVTLKSSLPEKMEIADGFTLAQYLARLCSEAITVTGLGQYAEIVKRLALGRRTIGTGQILEQSGYLAAKKTEFCQRLKQISSDINYVLTEMESDAAKEANFYDSIDDTLNLTDDAARGLTPMGISPGIHELDSLTGPWQGGQLIIIGGDVKQGKSAAAWQSAFTMAEKHPIGGNSGEMPRWQLIMREKARRTGISAKRQKLGRVSEIEMQELVRAGAEMKRLKYMDIDCQRRTLAQIDARIERLIGEHDIKAFFLDHILKLVWEGKMEDADDFKKANRATSTLKDIAMKRGIPIIALTHLNKTDGNYTTYGRQDFETRIRAAQRRRPTYKQLLGNIDKDADHAIIVFNARPVIAGMKPEEGTSDFTLWETVMEEVNGKAEFILALSREEDFPRRKQVEWHGETTSYGPPFKQAFNERERLL
jgi:replicative DNA helicase